ncbi:hypothetical protein KIN20_031391 [Parelaphostrongylus tenuis]|uniref:Protein sleepless n=1 Tax=Parelaphostrongylus tenuis TaxID=148309 RepID=A0AAD5R5J8_PARTN|nr:hypothetical protein KIN20_031391 [Parelaphostrongylus tenuis]
MNLLVASLLSVGISGVFGIQCYICNSITHPECVDNFEQFLRNCPVKSFGGRKAVSPIGCRKYSQTANGETSIVRECAYLGEDIEDKSNKGSLGVSRRMSQCSDRPGCNLSPSESVDLRLLAVIATVYRIII